MSNRIDSIFARLRAQNQKAFVAYITAGDPSLDATYELALGLEKAGVDILELGVPFSDPLADGVVNQMAAQRGLESGTTIAGIFAMVERLRETSALPIVLFTYLNPVYNYGFEKFHTDAAAAGVDGLLLLDLPPDEAAKNEELRDSHGLAHIQLIAPTTPAERIRLIVEAGAGFIYYVSREGVTGTQSTVAQGVGERVALIRSMTDLPVVVGFGVSNPEQVAAVADVADGVVVGSAIVQRIADHKNPSDLVESISEFVRPLAAATKK